MTIATELLQQHLQWLVDDNQQWQGLIADDIVWDLPYAPSLGHPLQLDGRESVLRHVGWFVGAVKDIRFFDAVVTATDDPQHAIARVRADRRDRAGLPARVRGLPDRAGRTDRPFARVFRSGTGRACP